MDQQQSSPRILAVSWGHMEVEGIGAGKDFTLYPGGGREWDWSETGMSHSPGIRQSTSRHLSRAQAMTSIAQRQIRTLTTSAIVDKYAVSPDHADGGTSITRRRVSR